MKSIKKKPQCSSFKYNKSCFPKRISSENENEENKISLLTTLHTKCKLSWNISFPLDLFFFLNNFSKPRHEP